MDLSRLRELSGMPANDAFVFEGEMTIEQEIAALEAQWKSEPDPRSRSVTANQIKILKQRLADQKSGE